MQKDTLLEQLENLAETLGIELRYERIEHDLPFSDGGLCRIRDRYVLISRKDICMEDRIRTLGKAVLRFDLNIIYLRPGVRKFLSELRKDRMEN